MSNQPQKNSDPKSTDAKKPDATQKDGKMSPESTGKSDAKSAGGNR